MVAFIAEPVAESATACRRKIGDDPILERRTHRPVQQRERDRAKQDHAEPVEYGAHTKALHAVGNWRKRAGLAALASASLIAATGCEAPAPEGQVVANIDGTEITLRELAQTVGDAEISQQERQQALEALVARKIFAMEAERRALERTGDFHFALRDARETLLMEALRRDVRGQLENPDAAAIDAELASHPWRYKDRFVVTLAYPGQSQPAFAIDSANLAAAPPEALKKAEPGEILDYGGDRWQVLSRNPVPSDAAGLRREAANAVKSRATEREMRDLVETYRRRGQIRFQSGWGPGAEGER